jgi:hypothetical protein
MWLSTACIPSNTVAAIVATAVTVIVMTLFSRWRVEVMLSRERADYAPQQPIRVVTN